ncbi:MAG: hypothetical protein Q9160_002421 [Pyrenula sp. 1 TL-2023]
MPTPSSSPRRSPKGSPTSNNSPQRKALHERSKSQTNELNRPLSRGSDVYASTPFPTKPAHVLLPSKSRSQGSYGDEENRVSDTGAPHPRLEDANKPKGEAAKADNASITSQRPSSGSRAPTLTLRRSVAALRDIYESQSATPASASSPTLSPSRKVSKGELHGLDTFVRTVSDGVLVVNDYPSTIKKVQSDSSLPPQPSTPEQPSSPVTSYPNLESSSPVSQPADSSSSPNIVRIGTSPSPPAAYTSPLARDDEADRDISSDVELTSETLSDPDHDDVEASSNPDHEYNVEPLSPNLIPVGILSSPNLQRIGTSSPNVVVERTSDESISSLESLGTIRRNSLDPSEDRPPSSSFPSSSNRFSSSPPDHPLTHFTSASTLDLTSPEPSNSRPTTADDYDYDYPYSRVGLQTISETSSATSIQYPVVQAPTASTYAEIYIPKRNTAQLMSEPDTSSQWNPHLSTIPSEWSAERAQSLAQVEPPERTSWPEPMRPPFARRRDTTGSTIRVISEADQNESSDRLAELGQMQARPKASGFFSIVSSSDRSNSLKGSLRRVTSNSSIASSIGIPAWARRYYSQIGHVAMQPSSDQISTPISPPTTSASPPTDHFPLGIFRPRTRNQDRGKRTAMEQTSGPLSSNPPRPQPANLPLDPTDPRAHWAGLQQRALDAELQNPTRGRIANEWSPHLHYDNRAGLHARRNMWHAPSLDEKGEGFLTRRNAQVIAFIVGFILPLAWFVAAFLPLPPKPLNQEDLEQMAQTEDVEASLAYRLNVIDEIRYENARWWRNLNRFMCSVGVVVIVLVVYRSLCPGQRLPKSREATLRKLFHPDASVSPPSILDSGALLLHFPAPKTVTGEDVLELHVHGSPATVKAVLQAIPLCSTRDSEAKGSIRFAEAGEFTKRAFYNDRLDLTQIEALGDTLVAETEQQRQLAVRGSSNSLSVRYQNWRKSLRYARGELEALIDFSEDQHFDESLGDFLHSVRAQVKKLQQWIALHIENAARGELLRNGVSVALLGAPNAGKSSLLNRIVGREAAIVSVEEGTTRDIIDVSVDIGGWLVRLGDTAGLRGKTKNSITTGTIGAIEQEGIRRAKDRALSSDLILVILSVESVPTAEDPALPQVTLDSEVLDSTAECIKQNKSVLILINKIDKLRMHADADKDQEQRMFHALRDQVASAFPNVPSRRIFGISCKDAAAAASEHHETTNTPAQHKVEEEQGKDPGNLQTFLAGMTTALEEMTSAEGARDDIETDPDTDIKENDNSNETNGPQYWQTSLSVTSRQRAELQTCATHLHSFLEASKISPPDSASDAHAEAGEIDIVAAAEDLRYAAACLARITGKAEAGEVEDVLGVVFEK